MFKRPLGLLGVFLIIVGIGYFVGAGVAYSKTQAGYGSLEAFSAAQNVELSYNDEGQLVDRGTTEGAEAIMSLLEDDWDFPVVMGVTVFGAFFIVVANAMAVLVQYQSAKLGLVTGRTLPASARAHLVPRVTRTRSPGRTGVPDGDRSRSHSGPATRSGC